MKIIMQKLQDCKLGTVKMWKEIVMLLAVLLIFGLWVIINDRYRLENLQATDQKSLATKKQVTAVKFPTNTRGGDWYSRYQGRPMKGFRHDLQPKQSAHSCNETLTNALDKGQHVNSCVEDSLKAWFVDVRMIAATSVLSTILGEHKDLDMQSITHYLHMDRTYASTILMLWCGDKYFTFKHYLSVASVIKYIKPDEVRIYYNQFPLTGFKGYDQWLQYLLLKYPFFYFEKQTEVCNGDEPNAEWIKQYLSLTKIGMYVSMDVILTQYVDSSMIANYMSMSGQFQLFKNDVQMNFSSPSCHRLLNVTEQILNKTACFDLSHLQLEPGFIFVCKSLFCETARYLMYNNINPVRPHISDVKVIPNIVHYVMLGKGNLGFNFYMSILSFIFVGKVEGVYIHSDVNMYGKHWDKLQNNSKVKQILHVVYHRLTDRVFNQYVNCVQHRADTIKVELANKYGGIFADTDLMLIKPLDSKLYHYDFAIGRDYEAETVVNIGFFMSKPGSLFSQLYMESMHKYHDNLWLWNSGQLPRKLLEYNPSLGLFNPRLQTVCVNLICKPLWKGGIRLKEIDNLKTLQDWQKQVYSMHFVYPDPFVNEAEVQKQKGFVGELGRYILKQASLNSRDM